MTKTISLSDEAYRALAGLKKGGESFSDVALRLAGEARKRSILDFAGAWAHKADEAERLKRRMRTARDATLKPRYRP